jgi:hypothetical protein
MRSVPPNADRAEGGVGFAAQTKSCNALLIPLGVKLFLTVELVVSPLNSSPVSFSLPDTVKGPGVRKPAPSRRKGKSWMATGAPSILQLQTPLTERKVRLALSGLFLGTAILWLGSRFLLSSNFLPHWYCYVGNQRLLWTNVIADLVIGLSYVVISATLVWLARRAGAFAKDFRC